MFDDQANIQIVAQGYDFTAMWVVQVYIIDVDDTREVTLIALGDSAMSRVMSGARNTTSLSKSIKKRDVIANELADLLEKWTPEVLIPANRQGESGKKAPNPDLSRDWNQSVISPQSSDVARLSMPHYNGTLPDPTISAIRQGKYDQSRRD